MEKTPLQWFRLVAKEFSAVSDEDLSGFFELAALNFSKCKFGKKWNYAQALYAAHLQKTLGTDGGVSANGPVTSETVGPLSRSYANMNTTSLIDQELSSTGYGKQLIALKRTILTTPLVV